VYEGCDEMLAFLDVATEDVRPHLPEEFDEQGFVMTEVTPGRTGLYLSARRCDRMTVEGAVRDDTVDLHLSVTVDPRDKSVGFVGHPAVPFGVFTLQWVSNNLEFVRWLREGTGFRDAFFVPDLRYDFSPSAVADTAFFFEAPLPTPSPARVTGVKTVPSSPPFAAMEDFWALTSRGIAHFISDVPSTNVGSAAYTVTATKPGTPLYEMLAPTSPLETQGTRVVGDATSSNFAAVIGFDKCVHSPDPKKSFCTGGYTP
jgi:hypothetical protein